MPDFRCPNCDYDLRGIAGRGRMHVRCSECGEMVEFTGEPPRRRVLFRVSMTWWLLSLAPGTIALGCGFLVATFLLGEFVEGLLRATFVACAVAMPVWFFGLVTWATRGDSDVRSRIVAAMWTTIGLTAFNWLILSWVSGAIFMSQ